MKEMNAMVLSKMKELEQIGFPNLKSAKRPLEKAEITYENIPTLELARVYPLLSRPTLKVGGFQLANFLEQQHWTPLYFKAARFFYLIIVLLVQATQVEARKGHWDSGYLILPGILILIAIIILIVIAILCNCIRCFTGPRRISPSMNSTIQMP